GFTDWGDATLPADQQGGFGMWFSDYLQTALTITNANIQGMSLGIFAPFMSDGGPGAQGTIVQNSYLRNQTDVQLSTP
ncbi:hypothetical protein ACN2AY_29665, partial [Klebsiella pneumoniae]|uniref:hypothetical protein n=1 Tax=Klebsiella pneumoniae TaxID=573 RepID=UPI003AF52C23